MLNITLEVANRNFYRP